MKDIISEMGIDYIEFDNMGRIICVRGKITAGSLRS